MRDSRLRSIQGTPSRSDPTGFSKAVVFGKGALSQLIASQLEGLGFSADTWDLSQEILPAPNTPEGVERLRSILTQIRDGYPSGVCLHPGVGFWAERPELPGLIREIGGMEVVCPPASVLNRFSNQLSFLIDAERLEVPHLLLSLDPIHSVREINQLVNRLKQPYPFVLKAVKGGGNRGIVVVETAEDIDAKLPLWLEQVRKDQGEVILFAERYVEGARHVVIPFARLGDGTIETFPSLDASLQSRFRKIMEFCPASSIEPLIERELRGWVERLAESVDYIGVGSFEFLVDASRAFLIHGTPRLDSAFHLWEKVAGTQAVAWQLAAMEGRSHSSLPEGKPQKEWSSGISLRIYAEDSLLQLPQPGLCLEVSSKRRWSFSTAAAELDLAVEGGHAISLAASEFLGVLWVGARDRRQAITVALGVLSEIWIAGELQTNERFLAELLRHPWVREGIFHAGFVDEEFLPAIRPPAELLSHFVWACSNHPSFQAIYQGAEYPENFAWMIGDRRVKPPFDFPRWLDGPRILDLEEKGEQAISGLLEDHEGNHYRVMVYPRYGKFRWLVRIGEWVQHVRFVERLVTQAGRSSPKVMALVPGKVHSILFRPGASALAHQTLLVIESGGMLISHALPVDVRISKWCIRPEERVKAGQELGEVERA